MSGCLIRIINNGPYIVTGNVPLEEKLIAIKDNDYCYTNGKKLPQAETYALCRCGQSSNMPFCDGTHTHTNFDGRETASRRPFFEEAVRYEGSDYILCDAEELCAFARFCHKPAGDVWLLTEESTNPDCRKEAIQGALNCPAGRLVILDSVTGQAVEPHYQQSIVIIQDPDRQCSGPVWVRGGIPVKSSDGFIYEVRNRVTLCRCGKSRNKPFCDSMHVITGFSDSV